MQDNKNIVARWFKEFWGNPWNPRIVNELATSDIFVHYRCMSRRKGAPPPAGIETTLPARRSLAVPKTPRLGTTATAPAILPTLGPFCVS